MYEAIEYYQSLAAKFDSRVMFVPGMAVVAVGLCIWLAGLRWRKVLGATAGGIIFAAIALCLGDYGCVMMLIVSIIGMTVGTLVEKFTLGIFGVVMIVVFVLIIVASVCGHVNAESAAQNYTRWPQYEQPGVVIGCSQCIEITRTTGRFVLSAMIENIKSASLISIGAAVLAMLLAGFAAVVMPRVFIAIISSSLGSAVIFAGLIMLLFYKGFRLVSYISGKVPIYAIIVFVMLVFGTMVQLVLSPPAAEQPPKTSPEKNGDKK